MGEFLSKIEDFLFDILGLVLPGAIFIIILFAPIYVINFSTINPKEVDNSLLLAFFWHIDKITNNFYDRANNAGIWAFLIVSYIVGHVVKVSSIIKYEFFSAVFDKNLNLLFIYLYKQTKRATKWVIHKVFKNQNVYAFVLERFKAFEAPITGNLNRVFTFTAPPYFKENESIKSDTVNIINNRLSTNYPNKWYSVYKFSTSIHNQEKLKSLTGNFLAKYNLYRSLALIFFFSTIYFCFIVNSNIYLHNSWRKIWPLIILTSFLLWFTFHHKYKRYWTLCGNESLVSLYYFLNKKNINEN